MKLGAETESQCGVRMGCTASRDIEGAHTYIDLDIYSGYDQIVTSCICMYAHSGVFAVLVNGLSDS